MTSATPAITIMMPTTNTVAAVAMTTLPSAMMPAITKTAPSAMIQPDLARNGSSAVSCSVLGDPVKLDMVFVSRFCVQFPFCGVKQSMASAR